MRALTTYDVRWACDVLRRRRRRQRRRRRPGLDRGRPAAGARRPTPPSPRPGALWWAVDRPNLLIKIPATVEGLPAVTACLAEGICVNVTLIFALDRYRAVHGRVPLRPGGRRGGRARPRRHRSVASFFVSRVDTEVDKRLDAHRRPRGDRPQGQGGDRQRPARATRPSPRCSPARGGRRWPPRAPGRSARCGPRPASRTPPTTTPATSSTWSPRAPSTRCRRPPWTPWPTTAGSAATPSPPEYAAAHAALDGAGRGRRRLRRRGRRAGGRGRRASSRTRGVSSSRASRRALESAGTQSTGAQA